MRLGLAVVAVWLLLAGSAAAAKPDPWHRAPSPAAEWAAVKSLVDEQMPAGACGAALDVAAEVDPRMPTDYSANGASVDQSMTAGDPVDGWYIGVPDRLKFEVWAPGLSCELRVRLGKPVEMCDWYMHERYHDLGFKHGDPIPSMSEGGRSPWCHSSRTIRSMQAYHVAFSWFAPQTMCRSLGRRIECDLDDTFYLLDSHTLASS